MVLLLRGRLQDQPTWAVLPPRVGRAPVARLPGEFGVVLFAETWMVGGRDRAGAASFVVCVEDFYVQVFSFIVFRLRFFVY